MVWTNRDLRDSGIARLLLIQFGILSILFLYGCKGHTIKSKILGERRTFFIHLPRDYSKTNTSYPVLFILDAYDKPSTFGPSFSENAKEVETLTSEGISPMIVVGIKNTNRSRDMLPAQSSDNFLSFLTEEMIPLIEQDYRTSGTRFLYGRSDSGLFVLYALAKNPDVFSAYISSSPTVGHCPDLLQKMFTKLLSQTPGLKTKLFIIYGENDIPLAKDYIPGLEKTLSRLISPHFRLRVEIISGGGHIPETSLVDGLRFIFNSSINQIPE